MYLKQSILSIIAILATIMTCYGQVGHDLDKDTSKYKDLPLFIIKSNPNSELQISSMIGIDPNDINSINVFKNQDTIKIYGERAKNGVIYIGLKNAVQLLNIDQLYSKFNIHDKSIPLFIDSAIAYRPQNVYLEPKLIKYVTIQEEKNTGMKYVSIRTVYPIKRLEKGGIVLRGTTENIKINSTNN